MRGFTLIEIMVVVVIISIVAAVTLFSVDVTGHQKARTFAKELQFMMRHVSNEAILTGQPYALELNIKSKTLTPMVYASGAWRRAGDLDVLNWDKIMTVKMIIDGVVLEEEKEEGSDSAAEKKHILPKILFWTTGLWEPAGSIELLMDGLPYLQIYWTSSGKMEVKSPPKDETY